VGVLGVTFGEYGQVPPFSVPNSRRRCGAGARGCA